MAMGGSTLKRLKIFMHAHVDIDHNRMVQSADEEATRQGPPEEAIDNERRLRALERTLRSPKAPGSHFQNDVLISD